MIHARPDGNQGAAVMAGHSKALVAKGTGGRDDVGRHSALGVGVLALFGRLVARTIPAQVRANDSVVCSQTGSDVPPHEMRLREPVQKDDGGSVARDGDVQFDVGCYRDAVIGGFGQQFQ